MPSSLSPQKFVTKWKRSTLRERAGSQEHFIDLCHLVEHPTPAEDDPTGEKFTFEAGATKQTGGEGWADVWMKGYFAWEYKGKHKDLNEAYRQLLQYKESLESPPLLVVSDMASIIIHPQFLNQPKRQIEISLDDLTTPEGFKRLKDVFFDPNAFSVPQTTEQVTKRAATDFATLADLLIKYGENPQMAAHFLIRLLFCLFAEDVDLLPKDLLRELVRNTRGRTSAFVGQLGQLFKAMSHGGWFGTHEIRYFDGQLFDDDTVLPLDSNGLDILEQASELDWSSIEPSIFGTLFERSLDPDKRAIVGIGEHYTGKDDIDLIIKPVLMAPLRRRWEEVKQQASELACQRDQNEDKSMRGRQDEELSVLLKGFAMELSQVKVLDPACGSGNFLYVALKALLDLEKQVMTCAAKLGLAPWHPNVSPTQLHGIEINAYAHELAQATIWIGYIQWLRDNGFSLPAEPILKPIETIRHMDAVLAHDDQGNPVEPEWPDADVIIGNPPFLGGNKIRKELGDAYVEALFAVYSDRVPAFADLVCYWFEKARAMIEAGRAKRAGLLATQAIRGGANRKVLERIKQTGDIFWAQSDRDWILDGAVVHVSMVGFDGGIEKERQLDEEPVSVINADLQSGANLTVARRLSQNCGIAFIGDTKKGQFDVSASVAEKMLSAKGNPNNRPNADVIRPWINGLDIAGRRRGFFIIDFGVDMTQEDASMYEQPFEYVRQHVKPERDKVRNARERRLWWIHGRSAPDLRDAVRGMTRYIATPRVSKQRLFVYVESMTLPDGQVVVFARQDDYFLGVLHSNVHEIWARAMGTQLRDAESGFRYSQSFTFETFPFPWPPGEELKDDPRVKAIAAAAHEIIEKRDAWLNPPGLSDAELKKRTLTRLYNQRPTWLDLLHRKLDEAVLDAYGWPHDMSDQQILERLLALNQGRATLDLEPTTGGRRVVNADDPH